MQAPLRTDADFDQRVQEEHHVSETPLSALPIGLVSQFPLDYMHLVCIGVTKKLILLWLRGPLPHRLPSTSIERISKWLLALSRTHCEEFARRPRSLREIDRWKATELRCFLLYLGPCVLRGILSKNLYSHFLILHTAITILSSPSLCREYCSYAKELLICFVSSFQSIYGKHSLSYNVHSLVHLADDVLRYGPLDSFSAFPAENFMHHLKKLVRHSKKPLEQLVNRIAERLSSGTLFVIKQPSLQGVECSQIHSSGPLAERCIGPQYHIASFPQFTLRTSEGNNVCTMADSTVVMISNFAHDIQGNKVLIGKALECSGDLYTTPCPSSHLGIVIVKKVDSPLSSRMLCDVMSKCVLLPLAGSPSEYALLPLIHSTVLPPLHI
ncbi:uncharacterized protein LOC142591476 [Dermacentor variabilis]|uniref:uncharacterized protein LOC142591476 n=1 Tax=Dermacentor variabilis TaxID=34621 RepID=UPI003F5B2690